MRVQIAVLLLCPLVVAAGCRRGGGGAAAPPPAERWTPLPPAERLYYDNAGGIEDSVRLVVRSPEELGTIWRQVTSRQSSPPPVPAVDFQNEMVLVIGAGRMTPEDQIQVDSLGLRRVMNPAGEMVQVLAAMVRIAEGCRRFQIDAYPLEIVRIRRFDGPVTFVERREQATDCREDGGSRLGAGPARGGPTTPAARRR